MPFLLESKSREETKRVLNSLTLESIQTEDRHIGFLCEMLTQIQKSYSSRIKHDSSEDAFNQLFVWPFLDVIAPKDISGGGFVSGQPALESMTKQLKVVGLYVDDKNVYKSDEPVKLFDMMRRQENLLLKTSGCFTNNDRAKINFDHRKGVYAMLAMLKCVADGYR